VIGLCFAVLLIAIGGLMIALGYRRW